MEYCLVLKRKKNSDTCYNMDEPLGHYAKRNKPVTKRQILHDATFEVTRVVKFIDRKWKGGCEGLGGGWKWGVI